MKRNTETKPHFSSGLFWDTNMDMLDYQKRKLFVMGRVLARGTEKDEFELYKYYGIPEIKRNIVNAPELDTTTIQYLSVLFNIKPENFKCSEQS
jgi:hypothetical protein